MVLMSRIPTCAWLYVTKTMSNSSSLCGYSSRSRVFTASRACQITAVSKTFFFSLYLLCLRVYVCVTLTLTNGKAGPGAKGSFSCSIWYLRYSSTPSCSNTFCSRSVRNKTREETAMVTAFSGFGCRKSGETRQKLVRWSEKGR